MKKVRLGCALIWSFAPPLRRRGAEPVGAPAPEARYGNAPQARNLIAQLTGNQLTGNQLTGNQSTGFQSTGKRQAAMRRPSDKSTL